MPPTSANGTLSKMSAALFTVLKASKRSTKISTMLIGNDHEQAPHRALLVLKLTAPRDGIARWKLELLVHGPLHLLQPGSPCHGP